LHGQPGGARDWARLIATLGARASPVAPDRPGYDGRSAATGLEGNAQAALAALDAAGVERSTVVGHSFGAGVAAWLAANHPERVSKLVLAAPAANVASLTEVDRLLALPALGAIASAGMLASTGAALRLTPVRRSIAKRVPIDEAYLREVADMLLAPNLWRAFVIEQRALVRELPALEHNLNRIAAETLVVAGAADHVVPARAVKTLAAQIPGAQLVLLPRAGHLLPHLHAEQLARVVLGVGVPVG
jgi:pimeloyl-ACP methyl ester carboxylesterase